MTLGFTLGTAMVLGTLKPYRQRQAEGAGCHCSGPTRQEFLSLWFEASFGFCVGIVAVHGIPLGNGRSMTCSASAFFAAWPSHSILDVGPQELL